MGSHIIFDQHVWLPIAERLVTAFEHWVELEEQKARIEGILPPRDMRKTPEKEND